MAASEQSGKLPSHDPPISSRLTPIVSIVIVNYCQWRNTARLVRQLMASPAIRRGLCEVVVVDNNSPPHSIKRRLRRTPGVSLRCLRRNHGFSGGVNEGCRLSRGQWFLLLNPDVMVSPGWLDRILDYVASVTSQTAVGIVGMRLSDLDGTLQGSVGTFPTLFSTLIGQLRSRPRRKCRTWLGTGREVAWVTGCGMLIRRECFEQIRGFDRTFFLYYEDADLCKRARAAGWSVRHEPSLSLVHYHPLHDRTLTPRLRLLTRQSLLNYAHKHWDPWPCLFLAVIVWLEATCRGMVCGSKRGRGLFRSMRGLAVDSLLDRKKTAYRRAWRTAQMRSRVSIEALPPSPPTDEMKTRERPAISN
jgi:GT2 family glycosyltransferase